MINEDYFKSLIGARLAALGARLHVADTKQGRRMAAEVEDVEVFEGAGLAAQKEVRLLRDALDRIQNGTYGMCLECKGPISRDRLEAVLYAPLCGNCANPGVAVS